MALKLKFWGTSGSTPAPVASDSVEHKVRAALWLARNQDFTDHSAVDQFVANLPFPQRGTYKGNTTCIQIQHDSNEVVLCDAGTGLRAFSDSLPKNAKPNTYHIFLTHLHLDHLQGFLFFKAAYQPENKIIIHGFHTETEETLRKLMNPPHFPVRYDSLAAEIQYDIKSEGSEFQIGDLKVKSLKQDHPGDSWAYRFEQNNEAIVISTDAQHPKDAAQDPEYPFRQFFKRADILVFDGQVSIPEAATQRQQWGHSDALTAVELAAKSKVQTLVVTHHDPASQDSEIQQLLIKAEKHRYQFNKKINADVTYPTQIMLAHDGLEVEI